MKNKWWVCSYPKITTGGIQNYIYEINGQILVNVQLISDCVKAKRNLVYFDFRKILYFKVYSLYRLEDKTGYPVEWYHVY